MSLLLKVSNNLFSLAEHLCNLLAIHERNVFKPHYVVTQTDGMNIWLKQQIAEQNGIAANITFCRPNDIIFKIYQILGGPVQSTLSKEALVWFIYQQLGTADFLKRYPVQAAYLDVEGAEKNLKRMGLAYKLADLFDQYQIYRPETIKEWNLLNGNEAHIDWQAFLWLKAKHISTSTLPDKTVISDYIKKELKKEVQRQKLQQSISTIYFFGLSIITRYHLSLLQELSSICTIHFYLLNPSPEIYWLDDNSERDIAIWKSKIHNTESFHIAGNSLLTNWGKTLQNTFRLLFKNEEIINHYEVINPTIPGNDTLLNKIKEDIYNNAVSSEERNQFQLKDLTDGSIIIQSNYTVVREVEALYNYFVHLIDQRNETLSARDMVVMVNNIDLYAPYIKAIFDNAPYKFRYKIADTTITNGDNIFSALAQLLLLNEQNGTSEAIVQLLDSKLIRARFKITELEQIRNWVARANIKFGRKGSMLNETRFVSWEYGIKRLMYGICMSDEMAFDDGEDLLYPCDIAEGAAAFEVIKFCHFAQVIMDSVTQRKHERSILDWVVYIEQLVQNCIYNPEDTVQEDYKTLIEKLRTYHELNGLMDEKVPFEIFANSIQNLLNNETQASLFINEGITFCSLIPMRSIPFKVVAMLGLNNDTFPRKEQKLNFNLINKKHELGDRNVKDNDKHLFLETLLSAQKYLYLSYLGKSVTDNSNKPPSILIDELIAYIAENTNNEVDVKQVMITQQPLHNYSLKYNHQEPKLYRYTGHTVNNQNLIQQKIIVDTTPLTEISLSDLINFLKNGIKHYYNKSLGIYYSDDDITLSETELFELDSLNSWQLKQQLLQIENEEQLLELSAKAVRTGAVPLKFIGQLAIQETYFNNEASIKAVQQITALQEPETLPINLTIDQTTLKGTIDDIYDNKMIVLSWSSNATKYLIEAFVKALVTIAMDNEKEVLFVNTHQANTGIYKANTYSLTKDDATAVLSNLIKLYKTGLQTPIPFTEYACKDLKKVVKIIEVDDEIASMQIQKQITDLINNTQYKFSDPYIIKHYQNNGFESLKGAAVFKEIVSQVLLPLTQMFNSYPY